MTRPKQDKCIHCDNESLYRYAETRRIEGEQIVLHFTRCNSCGMIDASKKNGEIINELLRKYGSITAVDFLKNR